MNSRRVALLVTDPYYPGTMAGAHRVAKFAKYLPVFGWTPVVLCSGWTPDNSAGCYDVSLAADVCETIRVPHVGFGRTRPEKLLLEGQHAAFPNCAPIATTTSMLREAIGAVRRLRPAVLWSTALPMFPHCVASCVSRAHRIPWVADFRDLADQTDYGLRGWLRTKRLVLGERVICSSANAFVVPSEQLRQKLGARHRAPVHVIPNGFDVEDYSHDVTVRRESFVIAYFGIIYPFRDPRPLFEALDVLAEKKVVDLDRIRVEFYGPSQKQIQPLLTGFRCARAVEVRARVGRTEMFRECARAAVLLNLQGSEAGGAVPSKLMEYLGAERPILNVPGDGGPGDEVIRRTHAGRTAASSAEIATILADWYGQWVREGHVRWEGDRSAVEQYSRRSLTGSLAEVFSKVVARA